jgi:hypothetical protein
MFRFPHLGTPVTIRVPHKESQTIHPIQQLSGSALRGLSQREHPLHNNADIPHRARVSRGRVLIKRGRQWLLSGEEQTSQMRAVSSAQTFASCTQMARAHLLPPSVISVEAYYGVSPYMAFSWPWA